MTVIFDPRTDLHHCDLPLHAPSGLIFRCDECGQHWQREADIFGDWWRISERKARRIIRRRKRADR
jgi:hypothetical protein